MGYKFNPFTSELDVVDSQWEVNTYTTDFLQPKDTTNGLVIGQDLHSSITSAFGDMSAVFNDSVSGGGWGINYFANFAYGTGFLSLGGVYLSAKASGTAAAPTATQADDFLGGFGFVSYDGSDWTISGATHLLPGLWAVAATTTADGVQESDIWIGGLASKMISFETDTNAIKFNEAQVDSDITFYWGSGASLVLDGETGNITSSSLSATTANTLANIDTAQTFTNKRITPRVDTTTSSATPTINTDNVDMYGLTAQTADITSFTTNLSGTPTNGQKLWIYIVGTAARAITWGASFENGLSTLPTTTVTTQRLDVGFIWNSATSKWRCVSAGSS